MVTGKEEKRVLYISKKILRIFGGACPVCSDYPIINTLVLHPTALRIRLISRRLYHNYAGMDYVEHTIYISKGGSEVLEVINGEGFYFKVEKYISGDWESKILKSRC